MRKISIRLVTICQDGININIFFFAFFLEGAGMTTFKLLFPAFTLFFTKTDNQCIVSHFILLKNI